jgi:alpha-ketoglutarate-dependent 2,4-dichlorophenoxyacetate dioxygenase
MAITVCPITPSFAAEIGDIDLSRPLDPADAQAVKDAFATYSVLIFPEQQLSQDQHLDFARLFGPLETSVLSIRKDTPTRIRNDIADVSNLNHEDKIWDGASRLREYQLGNRLWHTDSSFKRVPARASLLYARAIPPVGGHTEFADMRAAYDALPDWMKRKLHGLVAEHAIMFSRAKLGFTDWAPEEREALPPVPQVMVRRHADSGRMSLYIASHAGRILGLPEAEGRALIDQVTAHATQRQFVYTHRWRVNDLVMWDDRCTMHRGTEFDDLRWRRDMQRATVSDEIPTCEREGVKVPATAAAAE